MPRHVKSLYLRRGDHSCALWTSVVQFEHRHSTLYTLCCNSCNADYIPSMTPNSCTGYQHPHTRTPKALDTTSHCTTPRHTTPQNTTTQLNTTQHITQHNRQRNKAQHKSRQSLAQHRATQHSTAQHIPRVLAAWTLAMVRAMHGVSRLRLGRGSQLP